MGKTRTAPWDYKERHTMPPDDLFSDCPSCGYHLGIINNQMIDCHNCGTFEQFTPEQAEEFKALDILVSMIPPEPKTDPLEFVDDWAADYNWLSQCRDSGYGDFGPM